MKIRTSSGRPKIKMQNIKVLGNKIEGSKHHRKAKQSVVKQLKKSKEQIIRNVGNVFGIQADTTETLGNIT